MKVSRARVVVQVFFHLAIIAHLFAYYWLGWTSFGGADVQAFFHDFLGSGLISAGVILLALAFLVTLVLGRVFCGWACHFGAFQDLAAWILRRLGLRPKPIQTRFLHHLPYALLVFTFILPSLTQWLWADPPLPGSGAPQRFQLRVDLSGPPWAHLPGFTVSVLTFLACGVGILFFLGTRGFCRFVCPYGAALRLFDPWSPFRVRRRDSCGTAGCGPGDPPGRSAPCTQACPMGVRVHEEAHLHGEVRDPDCVRCHRCVEACPRQALAVSFLPFELPVLGEALPGREGILHLPAEDPRPRYSMPLSRELLVAGFSVAAFAAWDLVYAAHFLAAAMALGAGFLALFTLELFTRRDLRLGKLSLRHEGRWTFAGATVPALFLLILVGMVHGGAFKALRFAGDRAYLQAAAIAAGVPDSLPGVRQAEETRSAALARASSFYQRALLCRPGDRITAYRCVASLSALGDPRAVAMAEDLAAGLPGDLDSRELLRQVRLRFTPVTGPGPDLQSGPAGTAAGTAGTAGTADRLDNHPPRR